MTSTNKTLEQRVEAAAKRYLELKDFIVKEEIEREGGNVIIAQDDSGFLVLAKVAASEDEFPPAIFDRDEFEDLASAWLTEHSDELDECLNVRGDSISIRVLSDTRALLRHTTNITAPTWA